MTRAYISASVEDETRIKILRNNLWEITDAIRFYKKVRPHITVIPPFTVEDGYEREVEDLVDDCPLEGRKVRIDTLGVYENIHKPYVVLLSIDLEIEDVRDELLGKLPQYTEGDIIDPVRPHITLFKTHGWDGDPPRDLKESLQREIMNRNFITDTEVSGVEVEFKD